MEYEDLNKGKKRRLCSELYFCYIHKVVNVIIDRPLNSYHPKHNFKYEVNYGFIPDTKAADGEEIDVYVLGVNKPLKKYQGICIAIIHRLNDDDDKLIVVPKNSDLNDFTDQKIKEITDFQEQYFKSVIVR